MHTQGKQEIPRPLLTLLAMETLHILLGLGARTRSLKSFFYSSFHRLLLSVQNAWNAVANIVLVTQALTKTGGWLPFSFFFCLPSQRRCCVSVVAVVVVAAVGGNR